MKYSPLEAAKLTIMQEISPNPHWGSSLHYAGDQPKSSLGILTALSSREFFPST